LIRIDIANASPLVAAGLAAALRAGHDWSVSTAPPAFDADVWVWHGGSGGETPWALPAAMPCVLLADTAAQVPAALAGPAADGGPEARAVAVLPTSATPQQLCAAVAAVLQGLSVRAPGLAFAPMFPPDQRGAGTSARASPNLDADHEPLTPREIEVYELIAKGLSNRDIAGVLGISAHTAKYHVGQILAKVGAATRAEAVSAGLRMGIIGL
jgi:DNA-binding CsgD family transcriptional regulator